MTLTPRFVRFQTLSGRLLIALVVCALPVFAPAAEEKEAAIRKDRLHLEGTWRIVALEVDGNPAPESDARKLAVVNASDGTWSLLSEGREVSRGTSSCDPTQKLKTLDFTPTDGEGQGERFLGIYELGENTRRMCFAPAGKNRPTEFRSAPGTGHILIRFERDKVAAIRLDRQRIAGTWRVVSLQVNGNTSPVEDARKLTVVNGEDGTWTLFSEGVEVLRGTSTIDPTTRPRTLDFKATTGDAQGKLFPAIYELGETTRRMCFAPPGKDRPGEFVSTVENEQVLLKLEREPKP